MAADVKEDWIREDSCRQIEQQIIKSFYDNSIMKYLKCLFILLCVVLSSNRVSSAEQNAALLYYRAFAYKDLLEARFTREELNKIQKKFSNTNFTGDQAKDYFLTSAAAIELAKDAARISHCDWGVSPLEMNILGYIYPTTKGVSLARLLTDELQYNAQNGKRVSKENVVATFAIARSLKNGLAPNIHYGRAPRGILIKGMIVSASVLEKFSLDDISEILKTVKQHKSLFYWDVESELFTTLKTAEKAIDDLSQKKNRSEIIQREEIEFLRGLSFDLTDSSYSKMPRGHVLDLVRNDIKQLKKLAKASTSGDYNAFSSKFKEFENSARKNDRVISWVVSYKINWERTRQLHEFTDMYVFILRTVLNEKEISFLNDEVQRQIEAHGWSVSSYDDGFTITSSRRFGRLNPASLNVSGFSSKASGF